MTAKKQKADLGVSCTWRAERRHWLGKYRDALGNWPQKIVPRDIAPGPRDRAKAIAWLLEFQGNAVALNIRPKMRPGGRALQPSYDAWVATCRKSTRLAPSTVEGYAEVGRNVIMRPFTPKGATAPICLGEMDLVTLGTDFHTLRAWIQTVSTQHSPERVRSAYTALRTFYDEAKVEKWYRGENPLRNASLERERPAVLTRRQKGGVVWFPLDLLQQLVMSRKVPLIRRVRYLLEATGGYREGEISGLTWRRLWRDGELPRVDVHEARRLIRAKGEVLGKLKTNTSWRGQPLHPAVVQALHEWETDEVNGVIFYLGRTARQDDPVFPSTRTQDKGGFARPDTSEHLRDDLTALGLPTCDPKGRPYTAQALRRTFGTTLERLEVAEPIRKRLMGHGMHDVTEEFYTGEDFKKMSTAVARLELVWVPNVPFDAPARSVETHQAKVLGYLRAHPEATSREIADDLGIPRRTVTWVRWKFRERGADMVSAVVPSVVSGDTTPAANVPELLEPRVGLEPTTCALRKRVDESSDGGAQPSDPAKEGSEQHQSHVANPRNDLPSGAVRRTGTKDSRGTTTSSPPAPETKPGIARATPPPPPKTIEVDGVERYADEFSDIDVVFVGGRR